MENHICQFSDFAVPYRLEVADLHLWADPTLFSCRQYRNKGTYPSGNDYAWT
ncbi:hypothetical protein [Barnesiella intestinihominis]|uniref:hypothetical protein n=1 Tax=Barnesiella intestinihominis TaxID=487174 RepID=UPI0039671727